MMNPKPMTKLLVKHVRNQGNVGMGPKQGGWRRRGLCWECVHVPPSVVWISLLKRTSDPHFKYIWRFLGGVIWALFFQIFKLFNFDFRTLFLDSKSSSIGKNQVWIHVLFNAKDCIGAKVYNKLKKVGL
jgi:hypothetical protein